MFIRTNDKTEYKRRNENKEKSADVNQFTKYLKHARISFGLKRMDACLVWFRFSKRQKNNHHHHHQERKIYVYLYIYLERTGFLIE